MLVVRGSWPGGLGGAAGTCPPFPMLVIPALRAPVDKTDSFCVNILRIIEEESLLLYAKGFGTLAF